MTSTPSVAIICPSHRPLDTLSKLAYNSILLQEYQALSLYFCINGVTENQFKIIERYIHNQNTNKYTVFLTYQRSDLSPGSARRYLLNQIKTDYVLFIDSDDLASKNLVSQKISCALEHNIDVVISSAKVFRLSKDSHLNYSRKFRSYLIQYVILCLFKHSWLVLSVNLIPNSGTLIKTSPFIELLKTYPSQPHEDFIFYNKILDLKPSIALILYPLVSYYISGSTTTGNKLKSKIWHYRALKYIRPKYSTIQKLLITLMGPLLSLFLSFLNQLASAPDKLIIKKNL